MDGRTVGKSVRSSVIWVMAGRSVFLLVGQTDGWKHGRADRRTDRQPENIMPSEPYGEGIMITQKQYDNDKISNDIDNGNRLYHTNDAGNNNHKHSFSYL